jgi:hypothetical protein
MMPVVRILIAIESSKKSWIVGANTPLKVKTSQFQSAAGDWKALLELIVRLRRQVARELGLPIHEIKVISCYEAGYDGFWLHHQLEAHGVRNHVLDPACLLVNRRAKPAKTDGIDVERMQRALGRYLRGEVDACSMVRVPSLEEVTRRAATSWTRCQRCPTASVSVGRLSTNYLCAACARTLKAGPLARTRSPRWEQRLQHARCRSAALTATRGTTPASPETEMAAGSWAR